MPPSPLNELASLMRPFGLVAGPAQTLQIVVIVAATIASRCDVIGDHGRSQAPLLRAFPAQWLTAKM